MLSLDQTVTGFVTTLHGRSTLADRLIADLLQLPTFKLLPVMLLVVGLWFSAEWRSDRRRLLFGGLLAGFITLVVTRVMQNLAPRRPRPALSGDHDFSRVLDAPINDWSSFPSDTAGLALAVATTVFLVSRRLGALALLWALVVTAMPRLYVGQHYLSDLLAGGAIGALITVLVARSRWSARLYDRVASWAEPREQLFYPILFFVVFQVALWFWDFRRIAGAATKLLSQQV